MYLRKYNKHLHVVDVFNVHVDDRDILNIILSIKTFDKELSLEEEKLLSLGNSIDTKPTKLNLFNLKSTYSDSFIDSVTYTVKNSTEIKALEVKLSTDLEKEGAIDEIFNSYIRLLINEEFLEQIASMYNFSTVDNLINHLNREDLAEDDPVLLEYLDLFKGLADYLDTMVGESGKLFVKAFEMIILDKNRIIN